MESKHIQPYVKCLPCSHWCIDENDEMFCQWYGEKCGNVKVCPVRGCRIIQAINPECLKLFLFNPKNKDLCLK